MIAVESVESGKFIQISGVALARERQRAFLNQEELAEKSGVSLANLAKIEPKDRYGVYLSTVKKLANGLGLAVGDLVKRIGTTPSNIDLPSSLQEMIRALAEAEGISPVDWIQRMADEAYGKIPPVKKRKGA